MAAKTVVGLEITEESVRAVEVTLGPNPTIVAYGDVPLPGGAAKDSEVLDKDAVALAVQQLWAQSGIKSRNVVLGVGSRRILVREHSTPLMSMEQIKSALPFQVQDLLPVPVNQAVLDFYPLSEENGMVNGLLVAAVAETIEELIATTIKAKLRVDTVDLVPFGLARAARRVGDPSSAVVMIYVGEHTTHVVIAVDGVPRFVRIVPAEVATSSTERGKTVEVLTDEPVEMAVVTDRGGRSSLRVQSDRGMLGQPTALLTTDDTASVSDLANRLRSTVAFYTGRPGALPIGGVFVSGAGAGNPGLVPALQHALDRPVMVTDVSSFAAIRGNAPQGELALNLVSTLGIVLDLGRKS